MDICKCTVMYVMVHTVREDSVSDAHIDKHI